MTTATQAAISKTGRPGHVTKTSSYKLQAIDRAFAVLDLLGEGRKPMGLAQITTALHLHKSTVHRFLMVLERHRMVERTHEGLYRLGLKLYDLGNRAVQHLDLRDLVQPHLRRLVNETGETAHLCILEKALIVYLEKIEPSRSVRMTSRVGTSNPVYCTSVGKAMLTLLPEQERREVLSRIRYVRLSPKTIMTEEELLKDLERTRRRGYAMDDEEVEEGVRCVGVAIVNSIGHPVAAVSVSGPSFRMTVQNVRAIAVRLQECVRAIEKDLGYTPPAN
jgi:DNA-binding IclR family transcriptional regulator